MFRKKLASSVLLLSLLLSPSTQAEGSTRLSFKFLQIARFFTAKPAAIANPTPLITKSEENSKRALALDISTVEPQPEQVLLQPPAPFVMSTTPLEGYPISLVIPSISLNTSVDIVGYTTIGDARTWSVPNTTVGTPEEQVHNNIILIGHTGRFNSILGKAKNIKEGDTMQLLGSDSQYHEYVVTVSTVVDVNDLTYIFPQDDPTVTIITCVQGKENLRRIVVGKKSKV